MTQMGSTTHLRYLCFHSVLRADRASEGGTVSPKETVLLLLLVISIVVLMMVYVVLIYHLNRYRCDIDPKDGLGAGRSRVWQINVLRWSNYHPAGHRLLLVLYLVHGLFLALLVSLMLFVDRHVGAT